MLSLSCEPSHGLYVTPLALTLPVGVSYEWLHGVGTTACTHASVPLPWWMSKSMIATLPTTSRWTARPYAAAIEAFASTQKPADWPPTAPDGPA